MVTEGEQGDEELCVSGEVGTGREDSGIGGCGVPVGSSGGRAAEVGVNVGSEVRTMTVVDLGMGRAVAGMDISCEGKGVGLGRTCEVVKDIGGGVTLGNTEVGRGGRERGFCRATGVGRGMGKGTLG